MVEELRFYKSDDCPVCSEQAKIIKKLVKRRDVCKVKVRVVDADRDPKLRDKSMFLPRIEVGKKALIGLHSEKQILKHLKE